MPEPTRDLPPAGHPTADPSADGRTADLTSGPTHDPPTAAPPPPAGWPVVPGYELHEEVGRGGMGVVYRARDLAFGRDVAVKLLQDKYPANGVAARRFLDEARITGQLQHPGIPAAYQTGTLPDGRPFLAMKLIKGQTLDDLLATPSRDRGRLVAAFEGVCQAVGYAHAHGVVHRDLKPANVMVGAFGEVQVMDWGLAKVLASGGRQVAESADPEATAPGTEVQSARDADEATQAGSILGTAAYMPPEQAIGAVDEVDARSDVFGLGAVLCAVLTGKPPYAGETAEGTRKLAARADLADAHARLAACGADPGLVALCRRCLSVGRAARPADAGEVARDVAALRAAADERVRRAELDRAAAEAETREQRKRRRTQLVFGGLTLLTLLAGGAAAGWQWWRANRALADVTGEQGKTAEALKAVTAEQAKTAKALADKTAEGAAKDAARDETVAALRTLTDQLVGERAGRQVALTDRDRQFFREVLGLWEKVAAGRGDGPAADALRAEGAVRVGKVRHTLGEWAEAEASYRAALAGYDRLAAAHPDEPGYQHGRAKARHDLGVLLDTTNRPAAAEPLLREAVAGWERLTAAHPAAPEYRNELAKSHHGLGHTLAALRRPADAERAFRAGLDVQERLAEAHPDVPDYRYVLATNRMNLAVLLATTDRPDGAERAFRAAAAEFDRLAAAYPAVLEYRDRLGKAQANLGTLQLITDRPADAEGPLRAAAATFGRLAAANPVVPEYQDGVATAHNGLGNALRDTGRPEEAEQAYRTAVGVMERLAAAHPAVTEYRPKLAGFRQVLAQAGRPAALARRLPGVKAGTDQPASPAEAVEFAELAGGPFRKEYELAARLYADAFAADPEVARAGRTVGADDGSEVIALGTTQNSVGRPTFGHRFGAACAALRAAAGDDPAAVTGWDEWGVLQDMAFAWLSADLAEFRRRDPAGLDRASRTWVANLYDRWLTDPDLASVRDPARRAWMPAPDRDRWEKFWAEVEAVRRQAAK